MLSSNRSRMQTPSIRFTNWRPWSKRILMGKAILNLPGVYLLAHFSHCPAGRARPDSKQVVYVGETCSQTLKTRWNQFDATVRGGSGHSGGWNYHLSFRTDKPRKDLFVAAMPVDQLNEELRPSFIRYAERKLIWDYGKKWGKPPQCNKK